MGQSTAPIDDTGYMATRDGRIINPRGHEMRPYMSPRGTVKVALSLGGTRTSRVVKDAVFGAFNPGKGSAMVSYRDGNPWNNSLDNLVEGQRTPGRRPPGTHCRKGHEFTEANSVIRKRGRECRTCAQARAREELKSDNAKARKHRSIHARRARLLGQQAINFTAKQLRDRIAYYGGVCWMCGAANGTTLDHVKPIAAGGAHMLSNLRPACRSCNSKKNARWPGVSGLSQFVRRSNNPAINNS